MPLDANSIRNQASLTTSTGRIWLIVGGIFTAISLGVLISMIHLPPPGLALGGAIAVAVLYVAMIVVRVAVPRSRRRLGLLAGGMLAIALIALVTATIVAGSVAIR